MKLNLVPGTGDGKRTPEFVGLLPTVTHPLLVTVRTARAALVLLGPDHRDSELIGAWLETIRDLHWDFGQNDEAGTRQTSEQDSSVDWRIDYEDNPLLTVRRNQDPHCLVRSN